MTRLELILSGLCAILWVIGWHAVVVGISINERAAQPGIIKALLFVLWPFLWGFIMFMPNTVYRMMGGDQHDKQDP